MDELGRELDLRARARHEFEAGPLSREEFTATVAEIDDEIARLQAAQPWRLRLPRFISRP